MSVKSELRLEGDDELDLQEALEHAFGFTLAKDDEGSCRTVGDVHALVLRNIDADKSGDLCATSMAFYRLRTALMRSRRRSDLRPATPLRLLVGKRPGIFLQRLERSTGLHMPYGWGGAFTAGGFFALAAAVAVTIAAISELEWAKSLIAAGLVTAGSVLMIVEPGRLPAGCDTLGALARRVAALNHARLVGEGAAIRDRQVWEAVVEVVSDQTGTRPAEITSDTWLFKRPRAA